MMIDGQHLDPYCTHIGRVHEGAYNCIEGRFPLWITERMSQQAKLIILRQIKHLTTSINTSLWREMNQ